MPELPEVEAVRRQLDSQGLVGRRVTGVELLWPRAVRMPSEEEFSSDVVGRRILRIRRRAKYLVLELGRRPRRALLLHLGMTGSLVVQQSGLERPRHTRNTLILDGGLELCFVDPRKLGAIWLVKDESEVLAKLGPEPLDSAFTSHMHWRSDCPTVMSQSRRCCVTRRSSPASVTSTPTRCFSLPASIL